ncbi:MAG: NAD(P)/FAD-dependent oxidoreductase [Tissierellia bacterium]|nr:NAD(P)/FAD-dependent oxidoreductase [Tissierellia bacterium]
MEKSKYLIIGNGIAGLSAAKEIRKNDKIGKITMVTSEEYLTYYRLKLSKSLSESADSQSLIINNQSWYDDRNIKVILSKIVERIDTRDNIVVLDDSSLIKYEKLLIATGAKSFIPPIHGKFKEGVFALRTIRDLNYIKKYLSNRDRVLIIGGGLLGLEAAWSLHLLGKKVSIVEFAPYLLPKQLDKELGDKLASKLEELEMKVYLASTAEEIIGDTNATGIIVNNGEIIKSDAIFISSGIRPNLDIIRDTDIIFDRGILVNSHLQTNIENIYAAGDVVEINNMIIGLWTTANEQGKIAGANMAGNTVEYKQAKLFTTLSIGDIKVFSVGNILDYDEFYEFKDISKDIHYKLYINYGKIIGAILFGNISEMNNIRNAVFSKMEIQEYLKSGIKFIKIQ